MKVGIYTLGCKVNTYESEYITSLLENHGYVIANFDDVCDIYIINTCTVTNSSDVKSRKMIRNARKKNPKAVIVAVGCYIQASSDNLIDDIDIAVGNNNKSNIIYLIVQYLKEHKRLIDVEEITGTFEDMFIEKYSNRTRAFVKIQDGCENFCSYCIIPYVRGKCRSKDFNTALEEIKTLTSNGYSEIVLTGIHTGNYGTDINTNFYTLLKEIIKIPNLKRLRISSIEITELNDQVLSLLQESNIIVDHLHIPIQSASDKVLKIMNRKYDLKYFIDRIDYIRKIRPNISITTDIIVGHPYEDDDEFTNGLDILRKIAFTKLHVFPYSKREGTPSASMPQVDELTKKNRVIKLLELSRELETNYMNKYLNKEVEVLVETYKDGFSIGHTPNYIQVHINNKYSSGEYVKVRINEIKYPYCIGVEINK